MIFGKTKRLEDMGRDDLISSHRALKQAEHDSGVFKKLCFGVAAVGASVAFGGIILAGAPVAVAGAAMGVAAMEVGLGASLAGGVMSGFFALREKLKGGQRVDLERASPGLATLASGKAFHQGQSVHRKLLTGATEMLKDVLSGVSAPSVVEPKLSPNKARLAPLVPSPGY